MCIPVPAEGSVGTARGRRWRGGGCKERKMQPARLRSQGMSRRGCKARGMEPARASSEPVFIGCEARASSERVSVGQRKGNGAGASTQHAKALAMLPAQASSRTATSREGSRRAGGVRGLYISQARACAGMTRQALQAAEAREALQAAEAAEAREALQAAGALQPRPSRHDQAECVLCRRTGGGGATIDAVNA